jgi:hypothetical protein
MLELHALSNHQSINLGTISGKTIKPDSQPLSSCPTTWYQKNQEMNIQN